MPLPIVPLAVLGALGAATAYVVLKKPEAAKADPAKATPIPGGGTVATRPDGTPIMSAQMQTAFQTLLTQGSDPDAMDAAADALAPFGFDVEVAKLRAQAVALRKGRLGGVIPSAPAPAASLPVPQLPVIPINVPTSIPDLQNILPSGMPSLPAAPASLPSFARVTTNDPPPSGDVYIVANPGDAGIPGVGAEKDGIVTVLTKDALGDGVWARVAWAGGSRLGPAEGFMKAKFLTPSAVGPLGTAIAGTGAVVCVAPSGCRLRVGPSAVADFRAIVGHGEEVKVRKTVIGQKLEAMSPGRGGWALCRYKNLEGWLPLEWLSKV